MSDLLAIARSGVMAYGKALDVLADNVANASTPGHVRRVTHLAGAAIGGALTPYDMSKSGGNGVQVSSVRRAANFLQMDSLRRAESQVQGLDVADRWLTQLQTSISGSASLEGPVNDFFAALSDFATSPTSLANREVVLKAAETLSDRFNLASADVSRIADDIRKEADTEVDSLNGLNRALAQINTQLRRMAAAGGNNADLADERDRLLAEMATILPIDVSLDQDGVASVRAGDAMGPLLVDKEIVSPTRIVTAPDGALTLRVGPAGNDAPATLTTGALSGLSFAHQRALGTLDSLDALATRVAGDVNAQLEKGVDLNGNPGTPLFATQKAVAEPYAANGGSARATAVLADGATPPGDLELIYDGTDWQLRRADLSDAAPPGVLTLDGITVSVFGDARNGDIFRIRLADGAAGIGLRPITGSELAAAPPYLVDTGSRDMGAATIEIRRDESATPGAAITPPLHIEVLGDGSLDLVNNDGDVVANGFPGDWLQGEGFTIRLTPNTDEDGYPIPINPGDIFAVDGVAATGANSGANGNAAALYALGTLATSAGTIGDAQDRLLTDISVPLKELRERSATATANRDTIATELQETSGVDLDREAAEMLRLQQAFQANARIITTAKEIFDTILAAGR